MTREDWRSLGLSCIREVIKRHVKSVLEIGGRTDIVAFSGLDIILLGRASWRSSSLVHIRGL